jgi:hypothetical protein
VEAQAALVGADGAVELDAEAAVDLQLALVVDPRHAEHDHALGLDDALEDQEAAEPPADGRGRHESGPPQREHSQADHDHPPEHEDLLPGDVGLDLEPRLREDGERIGQRYTRCARRPGGRGRPASEVLVRPLPVAIAERSSWGRTGRV